MNDEEKIEAELKSRGMWQDNCPRCKGTGALPPHPSPKRVFCPQCKGEGKIWRLSAEKLKRLNGRHEIAASAPKEQEKRDSVLDAEL